MKTIAIEIAVLLLLYLLVVIMMNVIGFELAVLVMLTMIWFDSIKGGM